MKNLSLTFCLGFAALLASVGVGFASDLPPCSSLPFHDCFGTYTWENGTKYVGEYKDGKQHGQGIKTWAGGNKYVGEWRDGEQHGQGIKTWANGDKYVGEWRDGNANGIGIKIYADGKVEEGIFSFNYLVRDKQGLTKKQKQILIELEEIVKQTPEEAEKKRKERLAKQAEKEKQRLADEAENREKRRLNSENNPGFRDIKPGLSQEDVKTVSGCDLFSTPTKCYDLDNISFSGSYDQSGILTVLTLDMGPLVQTSVIKELTGMVSGENPNIYAKMSGALREKYSVTHEYNERDRQLFNEKEKTSLYVVFEDGQVVLRISRIKKEYSNDLRVYVEYRDLEHGKTFAEETRPKRASVSDF